MQDDEALVQNSGVPVTPERPGYLTYSEWAKKVSQEFQEAIEKSLSIGDGGMAAYFLLMKQNHERQAKEAKSNYRGL